MSDNDNKEIVHGLIEKNEPELSEKVIKERKEKFFNYFKKPRSWIVYAIFIIIAWIGAFIRTRNIPLFGGKWIPDVDSYLFWRYANYIIEHGKLMVIDPMRYYPLGMETAKEANLLAYVLAYMYKFAHFLNKSISLWNVEVFYPVVFFILALFVFFLIIRRLFNVKVALLSAAFLAVVPAFLYRTMAGVSDKEPVGIFLMFCAFYFYVVGWQSKSNKLKFLFGALSGLSTSLMGLTWGGVGFISLIIPMFTFIEILFNKLKKGDFLIYTGWLLVYFVILGVFTMKYGGIGGMLGSWLFNISLLIWIIALMLLISPKVKFIENIMDKLSKNFPKNIIYIVFSIILVIIVVLIIYGPGFLSGQINTVLEEFLFHPAGTSRFQLTVAESHQPYFLTWIETFGWVFFWLFFVGSIVLFWSLIKPLKKHKILLTTFYVLFLSGFIFTRYSPSVLFNGENFISKFAYAGSLILFVLIILYVYINSYKSDKEAYFKFTELDKKYTFLIVWFVLMIVAGRTAIRLLFVFAPIACFMGSYIIVTVFDWGKNAKNNMYKYLSFVLIALICYLTLFSFMKESYNQAKYTGLSYGYQWQTAGDWVINNTAEDAVFAHWWDYGYWVQTGWNRTTVTDGGNALGYWNHLLGRHFLTGQNEREALEFLYAHNVTYALIISDEIGKYGAYSSIGGDENNDRASYVPTFGLNQESVQETRNGTSMLYNGAFGLDDDVMYQGNIIPKGQAFVGAVVLSFEQDGNETKLKQPYAIVVYGGKQLQMTMGCVYFNGQKYDFAESDLGSCFRMMPTISSDNSVNAAGSGLYVSEKVSRTMFAKLFLFDEEFEGFELVYDDSNNFPLALYNGNQIGPLRIWKVHYPKNIEFKSEYLETKYPDEKLYKL